MKIDLNQIVKMKVEKLTQLEKAANIAGDPTVTNACDIAMDQIKDHFWQSETIHFSEETVARVLKDARTAYSFFTKYNHLRMVDFLSRN